MNYVVYVGGRVVAPKTIYCIDLIWEKIDDKRVDGGGEVVKNGRFREDIQFTDGT